jgi:hypothetical protein
MTEETGSTFTILNESLDYDFYKSDMTINNCVRFLEENGSIQFMVQEWIDDGDDILEMLGEWNGLDFLEEYYETL